MFVLRTNNALGRENQSFSSSVIGHSAGSSTSRQMPFDGDL